MIEITKDTFVLFSMQHYTNITTLIEFNSDIERITYIKRLLNKYNKCGVFRDNLIFNHLTVLCNVFSIDALINMIFYKCELELWTHLKTIFTFMDIMPLSLGKFDRNVPHISKIATNKQLLDTLNQRILRQ